MKYNADNVRITVGGEEIIGFTDEDDDFFIGILTKDGVDYLVNVTEDSPLRIYKYNETQEDT